MTTLTLSAAIATPHHMLEQETRNLLARAARGIDAGNWLSTLKRDMAADGAGVVGRGSLPGPAQPHRSSSSTTRTAMWCTSN